jgi:hypothetical protein
VTDLSFPTFLYEKYTSNHERRDGRYGYIFRREQRIDGCARDTCEVYNPFPGSYHPDYLSQSWVQPAMASAGTGANDALPFAGVVDGVFA